MQISTNLERSAVVALLRSIDGIVVVDDPALAVVVVVGAPGDRDGLGFGVDRPVVVDLGATPTAVVDLVRALWQAAATTDGRSRVVGSLWADGPGREVSGATLTVREHEVLDRLAQGERVAEIATVLGISERTVRSHKERIYAKLDVGSDHAAVAAVRSGRPASGSSGAPVRSGASGGRVPV